MSSSSSTASQLIYVAMTSDQLERLTSILRARNSAHIRKTVAARAKSGRGDPIPTANYIDIRATMKDNVSLFYVAPLDPNSPWYHEDVKPVTTSSYNEEYIRAAAEYSAQMAASFQQLNVSSSSSAPQHTQVQFINDGQSHGFVASSLPQGTAPSPFVQQPVVTPYQG